jgi:hypothetical protein
MTTERQKAQNLRALAKDYGFDLPGMIQAAFRLGVIQGQADEAFRRFDQMALEPGWREEWLRGKLDDALLAARKHVAAGHAMAHLIMDDHAANRSPNARKAKRGSRDGCSPAAPRRDAESERKRRAKARKAKK